MSNINIKTYYCCCWFVFSFSRLVSIYYVVIQSLEPTSFFFRGLENLKGLFV
jgi:hypothetical protein